jgi:hypothetical protein
MNSKKKIKKEYDLTIKELKFKDDLLILKDEKTLSSDKIFIGENVHFSTKYENKYDQIRWEFHIFGNDNKDLYNIIGSTTAKKGILEFNSEEIDSLSLLKGDYKAIFLIKDEKGNELARNERSFSVEYPEFSLELPREKYVFNYNSIKKTSSDFSGKEQSSNRQEKSDGFDDFFDDKKKATSSNFSGASTTIVIPVLLKNDSTCGLIYTMYERQDNEFANKILFNSRIYFNGSKEIMKWNGEALFNDNEGDKTIIDADIANNKGNPIKIRKDNPIYSHIAGGLTQDKYHELKRKKEIIIFPFIRIYVKGAGDSYYSLNAFLPGVYQVFRTFFGIDYENRKPKLCLFNQGIKKPMFLQYAKFNEEIEEDQGTNFTKSKVGLVNMYLYSNDKELQKYEITHYLEGKKIK